MNTMDFKNVPHRLGKSIKDLREILNLTQLELAKQAGVSRTVIYHLEQEKHIPHILNLLHICNALHITPAELFAQSLPDWTIEKNTAKRAELHKSLRRTMSKTLAE